MLRSWYQAFVWGLRPDFYYCKTIEGFLMLGDFSDKRRGLSFTNAAASHQSSNFRVRVPWDSRLYFAVKFGTSFFVASYDSQGYGGAIRTHLLITFCKDRVENTVCKYTYLIAWLSFAEETCLPNRCLEMVPVYLLISRHLHSNGFIRYYIFGKRIRFCLHKSLG
jgi:hypothetical protein